MTKRQRVIDAFMHKSTDMVPYHIDLTHQEAEKLAAYLGDPNFYEKIGNHAEGVYYGGWPREMANKPGHFLDDFGVLWNRNGADKDIGVIEGSVIKEPSMAGFQFKKVDAKVFHENYQALVQSEKDAFKFGSIGFSMYERAWTLRGMEQLLTDMILEPSFVEELLDAICEYNLEIIDIGLSYDIDGFYFGDDWGQQSGLIMGPRLWRKFIKPRIARMYERVKSKGKFVIQHSCGDVHEIFPDLIDIGLDVYQTFQPEIYDIKAVKKEFGQHLSFWGGISTQRLLPFATPEVVVEKSIEIMRTLSVNGGYIAAPTHAIPGDVPPENVVALIELLQNQHKYL